MACGALRFSGRRGPLSSRRMRHRAWCGGCRGPWPGPDLPTAYYLSIRSYLRFRPRCTPPGASEMASEKSSPEVSLESYQFLRDHVHTQSGIVLGGDKHYLFETRLDSVVR